MRPTTYAKAAVSGALAFGLLAVALPHVTGIGWGPAVNALGVLHLWQVGFLLLLWFAGLYAHTFVATAAMDGLTHRQAFALNFSGSAVANVVPFGGALGMGLNYKMIKSWGHAKEAFAPFTTITTLINVLVKLFLPVVALSLLLLGPGDVSSGLRTGGLVVTGILVVLGGGVALLLTRPGVAERLLGRIPMLLDTRHQMVELVRAGWRRMLLGSVAYAVLQALLLWSILEMLGSDLGLLPVFTGFAFGRVLTLLVLTPGGVGISETGSAGLLIALGGDPALVASGTLLFSALTYALEIPVGGVCGLVWWRSTRRIGAVA